MQNWNYRYNWTKEEFQKAVTDAFTHKGLKSVNLDVEHSDRTNMENIKKWAAATGFIAREINSDILKIERG